jgi:transposase
MAKIEKKTKRYPSDLTDEEWARIEPLLQCIEGWAAYRGRFAGGVERDPLHGPFGRGMADAAE